MRTLANSPTTPSAIEVDSYVAAVALWYDTLRYGTLHLDEDTAMPREGVTYEQVCAVVDRLQSRGEKPTNRAVLAEVGGSMGTVQPHMVRYREEHRPAKVVADALPSTLQQAILDAISEQVQSARSALEQQLSEGQDDIAELVRENASLEVRVDDQAQAIKALECQLATEQGRAQQLSTEIQQAEEKAVVERQAAEAARIETAQLRLRLEGYADIKAEMQQLRDDLRVAERSAAQATADAAAAKAKADASKAHIDTLTQLLGTSKDTGNVSRKKQ